MDADLPPGWAWTTVEDLASLLQYGSSAKTDEEPVGVPVLRMGNIVAGRIDATNLKFLPATHDEFPELLLRPGDVLFNRTNSAELVGKTAAYTGAPSPCSFASYLIRVRLGSACVPAYLSGYINSVFGRNWVASVVNQQVGQANVNGSKLRALNVPLPPLSEQQRIVAAIEQHTSDIDAGVVTLERVLLNLKRYRASVLKAACEGKLVPTEAALARKEGRSYEPAEVLLQRILKERRERWEAAKQKGKYEEPEGPNTAELADLPQGWVWATAVQVCRTVVDCHNKTAPYVEAGIPLLRTSNIRRGRLLLDDLRYVTEETYAFWSRRCPPEAGDVLFTREAPMGEAALVPQGMRVCMGQRMMLLRAGPELIAPSFLLLAVQAPHIPQFAARRAVGMGVQHLRVADVERLPIPLPPLAEQHRIVAEVDRLLSVADETEAAVRAQLARAERLRQAVLKRAFEGKLVPQDPNDEPASVLLERIRTQQAAAPNGATKAPRAKRARVRRGAPQGEPADG